MMLAYELGRLESEILDMSTDEFARWVAYFEIRKEDIKKASGK